MVAFRLQIFQRTSIDGFPLLLLPEHPILRFSHPLGGLTQNGSITEANFLDMLKIPLVTEGPITVQHRSSGHVITRSHDRLDAGGSGYDIRSTSIFITLGECTCLN